MFARVAEAVPGIGDDESEEEFDLAAMMAKQRAQAASLHQEAQKLRTTSDTCASGCHSANLLHAWMEAPVSHERRVCLPSE